jgi:hypothetical protein
MDRERLQALAHQLGLLAFVAAVHTLVVATEPALKRLQGFDKVRVGVWAGSCPALAWSW